ncbi:hypothetical protein LPJ53_001228 [Coemansia erecta]|uniref:Uncharacterized protein n=1 Tax=Coemansia erecta TaxID=147472 RepID=A0A9W7Y5V8_9FUNG|nr:hypothetical protein LPJ53_001228 [Coemansia erecta]
MSPNSRPSPRPTHYQNQRARANSGQPNVHSRAVAREQMRPQRPQQQQQQNQTTTGILEDLNMHHTQNSRDIHTVFVSTPIESITGSAYVSGHLTPSDQWVAVGSESSGVISLTSSDNEDDGSRSDSAMGVPDDEDNDKGKQAEHTSPQMSAGTHYQDRDQWGAQQPMQVETSYILPPSNSASSRWKDIHQDAESEHAVHLLRESVASLLSSSGGSAASSVASAQRSSSIGGAPRRLQDSQYGIGLRRSSQGSAYRQTRSPSSLSKVSEPCYPPSAPRRKFTASLDHFSDIALSSTTTPPRISDHPQHAHVQQHLATAPFPSYEEYKQQQQQRNLSIPAPPTFIDDATTVVAAASAPVATVGNSVNASMAYRKATTADALESFVDATVPAGGQRYAVHPLLAEIGARSSAVDSSLYSAASRSPFASIRTVSPVLVTEKSDRLWEDPAPGMLSRTLPDAVNRARAAEALEQTIYCPLKMLKSQSAYLSQTAPQPTDSNPGIDASNSANSADIPASSGWAKYTGYAIVGFGVGTLVGMLCLEMANMPAPIPKATRSFPVAGM